MEITRLVDVFGRYPQIFYTVEIEDRYERGPRAGELLEEMGY